MTESAEWKSKVIPKKFEKPPEFPWPLKKVKFPVRFRNSHCVSQLFPDCDEITDWRDFFYQNTTNTISKCNTK